LQVRAYCLSGGYDRVVPTRAEASEQVRDAIVAATVQIVGRDGVGAVTHRRVAELAGVSLSSTTWHFASKEEILEAALRHTARREVERVGEIAARIATASPGGFDAAAWARELAAWVLEQTTGRERDTTVALYRLQLETLGRPGAIEVHRAWGAELEEIGGAVLAEAGSATAELDVRLVIAALDGLRLSVLSAAEQGDDLAWLEPAVRRLVDSLV
jgi:TetR/AcrR family transcriptional regulator, regulator of biofilm formation and stress response